MRTAQLIVQVLFLAVVAVTQSELALAVTNPNDFVPASAIGSQNIVRVWHVYPDSTGDAPSIAAAIDSASNGDTVLIHDGTYFWRDNQVLSFGGKSIVLRSVSGPSATVFECELSEWPVRFVNYEDSSSVLEGLTFRGGRSYILCELSSPRIRNCRFVDGVGFAWPYGYIHLWDQDSSRYAIIEECLFENNAVDVPCQVHAYTFGEITIWGDWTKARISGCEFRSGAVSQAAPVAISSEGGTRTLVSGSVFSGYSESACIFNQIISAQFSNCTFSNNGVAVYETGYGWPEPSWFPEVGISLAQCIISYNLKTVDRNPSVEEYVPLPKLNCCDVFGNSGGDWVGGLLPFANRFGNQSLNPLFCDPAGGYFRIDSLSPCAAGSPLNSGGVLIGALVPGCRTYADSDEDAVADVQDNCANIVNTHQLDSDSDGQGDACDPCIYDPGNDFDADGRCGNVDNCPLTANPDQADSDGDGIGDACEASSSTTQEGTAIAVSPLPSVVVTFDSVSISGITQVLVTSQGIEIPGGYQVVPAISPNYYQIATNASIGGLIEVCITYDPELIERSDDSLRLLHFSAFLNRWEDITTSIDSSANILCGRTWTLSPFVIVEPSCCVDATGNVNGDSNDLTNVSDLTYLVNYLFRGGAQPSCPEEAEVNGDGSIKVSDLTFLVNFLFKGGAGPKACP